MSAADSRVQWNHNYRVKGAATRNYRWVVDHLAKHGEFKVTLEQGVNEIGLPCWQIWSEPVK